VSVKTIGVAEYILKLRDEMTTQVQGITQSMHHGMGAAMLEVGKMAGKMGDAITAGIGGGVKEAISFESAFADVRKTVEASEPEYAALNEQIRQMSMEIPVAAGELAGIASTAGQLGIQKENIIGFTRTIADLGVSSNMTGEQGATMLARFANITNMPQTEFSNLASAIVDLGNNSATTESEIAEMALRIAGAGEIIGMSQADILGVAAALSSVGIEAQAGGSSISKVMIQIAQSVSSGSEHLEIFASVAGQSADQFAAKWQREPALALDAFVQGLGRIHKAGGDVFGTLEALGITEVRMRDALLRSATAGDLMTESIRRANTAYKENNALSNEAAQRYATTESQLQILRNNYDELKRQIGEALLPALKELVAALLPIVQWLSQWIQANPELAATLIQVIAGVGLTSKAVGMLSNTIGSILFSLAALKIAFPAAGAAAVGAGAAATTAAGTAAGGTGLLGLAAALGAAAAGFVALVTVTAAAGVAVVSAGAMAISAAGAYMQMRKSQDGVSDAMERYMDQLEAKGIAIDRDKARGMEHGEAMRYLMSQEAEGAENLTRMYIANVAGRKATDEEYARAKNLMLNENVSREEAAVLAVKNLSAEAYREILTADKDKTNQILGNLRVRVDGETEGLEHIRDLSTDLAQQQVADAQRAAEGIVAANHESAGLVASIWQGVINMIANAWYGLMDMIGFAGSAPMQPLNVPGMATGGQIIGSGLVQLHKDELLAMPAGAEVIPRKHSQAVKDAVSGGGGMTVNVNVNGAVIREEKDIKKLAGEISRAIATSSAGRMRGAGLTPNLGAT
jgi:TP901 family phage tail tape measure protein